MNKEEVLRFIDELWEGFKDSSNSPEEQKMHLQAIGIIVKDHLREWHPLTNKHYQIVGKKDDPDQKSKLEENLRDIKEWIKDNV